MKNFNYLIKVAKMSQYKNAEKILKKHRDYSKLCCVETCLCWQQDKIMVDFEIKNNRYFKLKAKEKI